MFAEFYFFVIYNYRFLKNHILDSFIMCFNPCNFKINQIKKIYLLFYIYMDIKNSNICYNNIKGDNNRKIYYVSGSSGSGISNMTLKQEILQ